MGSQAWTAERPVTARVGSDISWPRQGCQLPYCPTALLPYCPTALLALLQQPLAIGADPPAVARYGPLRRGAERQAKRGVLSRREFFADHRECFALGGRASCGELQRAQPDHLLGLDR